MQNKKQLKRTTNTLYKNIGKSIRLSFTNLIKQKKKET